MALSTQVSGENRTEVASQHANLTRFSLFSSVSGPHQVEHGEKKGAVTFFIRALGNEILIYVN